MKYSRLTFRSLGIPIATMLKEDVMASHIIYQDSYLYCAHAQSLQPNPQTANTSIYEAMAIYYNILGHKRVLIEGSIYTLRPGELFILNESEAFIVYEDAEEPSEYLQLVFSRYVFRHLDPDFSLLSRCTHRALSESNVIRLDDRQNALFSACLKHIEQNRNRPDLRISFLGILMIFINEINISNWYCAPSTDSDGQKIIAYINENLQVNLTNESVARHFYMSESQFCRYFKRLTGTTLTNYVNKKRVNLARDLLRNNVKIKDVVTICGFHDYTTFYKHNIKYYKMPPSRNYTRKDNDPLLLHGLYQID